VRYALVLLAACHASFPPAERGALTEVTLYRDAAVVRERVEADLPAGPTSIAIAIPGDASKLGVVDRSGLAVTGVHVPLVAVGSAGSGDDDDDAGSAAPLPPSWARIDVVVPHAGHYAIGVAYVTRQVSWRAAYTLTTTTARDRATLHGALAVTSSTGLALPRVALRLVDAPLDSWRAHARETLAASLVGELASTTPVARPRTLGDVALEPGETIIDMPGISKPRAMRSVLVYDPIGTSHDNPGAVPVRDASLGVSPPPSTRVTESFEIMRDAEATDGMPAGPVKLYEAAPSGALALLGEARLFDDATRVAKVDTIPIGTAAGVTARRERRELTVEDDAQRHRVTEEFVITVDNARDRPVDVLVREHLYRGQTWLIAYESTNHPAKEGAQQIALRTDVPARAEAEVTYVVVYSWKP
jgi:hypothetical protein